MKRLLPLALVAALSSVVTAAVIALPAIADDDSDKPRAGVRLPSPFRGDWRRFADCMREHGFDLSGETTVRVTPDGVTVNGRKVDADAFHAAEKECGPPWRGLGLGRGLPRLGGLPGRAELEQRRDAFLADVAKRLGVTTAQLKDALRAAAVARVDELERSGEITAGEADELRERVRAGGFPFVGAPFLHGPPPFFRRFDDRRDSSGAFTPPDLPSAA